MTRACHLAVRAATGDVFSDKEIDDLLDRVTQRARRAGKDAPSLSEREAIAQAAAALSKEDVHDALIARRLEVASKVAAQGRARRLSAMPASMKEWQRLDAYNTGKETQGFGTSDSVDAYGRALQVDALGRVELGLRQMPGLMDRVSNPFNLAEKGVDRLIIREMARLNGDGSVEPTGDEGALHFARVATAALERIRQLQNDLGAWIGRQEGYIMRQSHDAQKVAGGFWREIGEVARRVQDQGAEALAHLDWGAVRDAAEARSFGAWRDFIMPRLHDKTFEGLTLEDVPFTRWEDEAQEKAQLGRQSALRRAQGLAARGIIRDPTDVRELMLHGAWMDIVTGRHAELSGQNDGADFRPSPSLARSVSKARVFHFKDPDAWVDYNTKYGRSSVFAGLVGQLERGARNAALLERWGPSPDAAFAAEKSRMASAARARGDVQGVKALDGYMRQANFDQISGRGDVPENMRLAQVLRTIRGIEALTKLGSITLSKTSDLVLSGHTMARTGAGFLAGYEGFFKGVLRLGSKDAKAAADALYVGARSFAGHLGGQFAAADGAPGVTSYLTRLMLKINAFERLNDGARHGAVETLAAHLGRESEQPWHQLDVGTRETFERFSINEKDWEYARKGLEMAPDGRTYFTLDHLDRAPDKTMSPADRRRLKMKFLTLIHNVADDSVGEPRARERAQIVRGTRPGTLQGEIMRSFFQFKGWVNTIVGRHLLPASQGYAGYKPVALMAHLILGSIVAGYIGMNLKAISRGEQPRSIIGQTPQETMKIWGASLAQGGGLGLYGDFLFGEHNRNGASFDWGQMGGPIIGDSEQAVQILQQAITGQMVNENTGRSILAPELMHLGSRNIPLVNVWYTRLALDYLLLWRMQEAASPGYLSRLEASGRRDGTKYIVPPSSAQ